MRHRRKTEQKIGKRVTGNLAGKVEAAAARRNEHDVVFLPEIVAAEFKCVIAAKERNGVGDRERLIDARLRHVCVIAEAGKSGNRDIGNTPGDAVRVCSGTEDSQLLVVIEFAILRLTNPAQPPHTCTEFVHCGRRYRPDLAKRQTLRTDPAVGHKTRNFRAAGDDPFE